MPTIERVGDALHHRLFDALYDRSLLYNTCWEDPAVDRQALSIGRADTLAVITSAGCNVLDYALCSPRRVLAIDANPRQTALLELKLAGIAGLGYGDFFALFGEGRHPRIRQMYADALRERLSPTAREFWDRRLHWFEHADGRGSFYFHGLAGLVARTFAWYLRRRPRLREAIDALISADNLVDQRRIYDERVEPLLWQSCLSWALSRQATMSLLGVPCSQRHQVEASHGDGIAGFIRASMAYVFRCLPIATNYFWTVYLRGGYTRACCPEYLKRDNFLALKGGLAERITPITDTVANAVRAHDGRIDRFVLLDHMDWMSWHRPAALADEWQAILAKAGPEARAIFRSASPDVGYLTPIVLQGRHRPRRLLDHLVFHPDLAAELHVNDRVHTYASFHIADVRAA